MNSDMWLQVVWRIYEETKEVATEYLEHNYPGESTKFLKSAYKDGGICEFRYVLRSGSRVSVVVDMRTKEISGFKKVRLAG